jgi:phytoene dehydrogenase-like protein
MSGRRDAVVVGSGPNGLAAAITLARAGKSVLVIEGAESLGGGMRSAELTLPGFLHDICSSVQALSPVSPFFRDLPLRDFGLELIAPGIAMGHPLDDRTAAVCFRSVDETADGLGCDRVAYRGLIGPPAARAEALFSEILRPIHVPRHPLALARFGRRAMASAEHLVNTSFRGVHARALMAGAAAHAVLPLDRRPTAAFGLVMLLSAHAGGWPFVRGGSQQLANALAGYLQSLGGEIATGTPVRSLSELPAARAVLLDGSPRQLLALGGTGAAGPGLTAGRCGLPKGYASALRKFRPGPGVHKVNWALSGPIPWSAPELARAGTVHVGGTFEEVAEGEKEAWAGRCPERPFVLLVQPSVFDPSRAPAGCHAPWGYCHVPNGSTFDMTERIEAQVERFAPGFRRLVLARHVMSTVDLERHNPNLIGGDITGGANCLRQVLARPVLLKPYSTRVRGLYLCSASTPPGGGVHGMCGFLAARLALRECF